MFFLTLEMEPSLAGFGLAFCIKMFLFLISLYPSLFLSMALSLSSIDQYRDPKLLNEKEINAVLIDSKDF